jgi:hypothetical protein
MSGLLRPLAAICAIGISLIAASSATAVPPQVTIIQFAPFTDTTLCSFPIDISFQGDIRVTVFFDKNGNPVRELDTFANFLVTFTHGTKTLTTKGPAHGITTFDDEGNIVSIEFDGMSANVTLPGQGHVLLDAGRLVFDADGNIVTENGPHQVFGTSDAPAFCAAMA